MSDQYDSNFIRQMQRTSTRLPNTQSPPPPNTNSVPDAVDPTRPIRAKQANLCDAVMMRVVEMEAAGNAILEAAKKLLAAVVANT